MTSGFDDEPSPLSGEGQRDPVDLFKQEITRTFAASQLPPALPPAPPSASVDQPTTEVPDARAFGIVPAPWLSSGPDQSPAPGSSGPAVARPSATGHRAALLGVVLVAVLVAAGLIAYFAVSSGNDHGTNEAVSTQVSQNGDTSVSQTDASSEDPSNVSASGGSSMLPGGADPGGTQSGGPTDSTDDVLAAVDSLLDDSTSARSGVHSALADIGACEADGSDISALQSAASVRRSLLTDLDSVDFADMPDGPALQANLVQALTASAEADDSYVEWGNDQLGCTGTAASDSGQRDGDAYSKVATGAKKAFLALWNPLAESHGYSARDESDI